MKTPVTPQEISDYKNKWMSENPFAVRLHSDKDIDGKDWCRRHLERYQWKMNTYTDVYEHTFYFEHEEDAKSFKTQFVKWADQEAA